MATNKTAITNADPAAFIDSVENPVRRADARTLLEMISRVTGCPPKMWGPSIIGFGRYHYKYDSGHEGDAGIAGFSPRKANLVVYLVPGFDDISEQLATLGKHKIGKSCLYINKLADVDLAVLEEIITDSVEKVRRNYETWDE
jgi:Domain of unknown function (DU1801)